MKTSAKITAQTVFNGAKALHRVRQEKERMGVKVGQYGKSNHLRLMSVSNATRTTSAERKLEVGCSVLRCYNVPFEDKCMTHVVEKGKKQTVCGVKITDRRNLIRGVEDFGTHFYDCPVCAKTLAGEIEKGKREMSEDASRKGRTWRIWFGQWAAWMRAGIKSGKFLLACFKMRNEIAELLSSDFPELYEADEIVRAAVERRVVLADTLARKLSPDWTRDEWLTEKALGLIRDPEAWGYVRYCLDNVVIPIFYRGNLIAEGPGLRLRAVLPETAKSTATRCSISWIVMIISIIRFIAWLRGGRVPGDAMLTPAQAVEYNLQLGLDASSVLVPAGAMPAPMVKAAAPGMRPAESDCVTDEGTGDGGPGTGGNEELGMRNEELNSSSSPQPPSPVPRGAAAKPFLTGKAKELAEKLLDSPRQPACLEVSTAILEVCRRFSLIDEGQEINAGFFRETVRRQVRHALGMPVASETSAAVACEKLSEAIAGLIEAENPQTIQEHIDCYSRIADGLAEVE